MMDNVFLLLAVAALAGLWGAKGARALRTPQVVGYVIVGVILGPTLLGLYSPQNVQFLDVLNKPALAIIGFIIGGELRYAELKKLGRAIGFIVILEAIGAFLLVAAGVYLLTGKMHEALLLGALSSATAPAGTVDILREYKAKGPLTTTLYAVVGLDDAIALILYGFTMPIAMILIDPAAHFSITGALLVPLLQILASLAVGVAIGALLAQAMRVVHSPAETLAVGMGAVFLCCAAAQAYEGLSLILANMALGATLLNWKPMHGLRVKTALDNFAPPLFVAFFVMVGARLDINGAMLVALGPIVLLYVVLRSAGKTMGCIIGGALGGAEGNVKRYVGYGLLSQAGVAIGLSLAINSRLTPLGGDKAELGHKIISVITVTTFVVQILGPPFLRHALLKTGEGRAPTAAKG